MPKRCAFLVFLVLTSSCLIQVNHSANVLCMFTSSVKSQLNFFMAVANTLIDRGHNITVITTIPLPRQSINRPPFRHIMLQHPTETMMKLHDIMLDFTKRMISKVQVMKKLLLALNMFTTIQRDSLNQLQFQEFLQEDNHFDLMLLGYYHNDYLVGIAARYGCPVAVITLGAPFGPISRMIGNPELTSFVQFPLFGKSQPMSFVERLVNLLWASVEPLTQIYADWIMEDYYKSLFTDEFYPTYSDVISNISLVLCNHHFSERPIRALVPALIEIGGIQVKDEPDPLPEDIQAFLDSSVNGTIIFSVGLKARGTLLKRDKLQIALNVLSKLNQTVLWEWEYPEAPPNVSNILFQRSIQHEDILFHTNVKLFITDGRLGNAFVGQSRGVPMMGIANNPHEWYGLAEIVNRGFGMCEEVDRLTEKSLKASLTKLLENPMFTQKVKYYANIYRDRPITARETAAFWLEYVIRHRGAPHMQSPLVHMDFVQRWNIDVIAVVWAAYYLCKKVIRTIVFLTRAFIDFRKELYRRPEKYKHS